MKELIEKISQIDNISELGNLNEYDSNRLIYAILKSHRYDLISESNLRLNINSETLEKIVNFLLKDENVLFYLHRYGFSFSQEELDAIFKIVCQKKYSFRNFFDNFFKDGVSLNAFIQRNEMFFRNYMHEEGASDTLYYLSEYDSFVKVALEEKQYDLIRNIHNYSALNLKLLVPLLKEKELPDNYGYGAFAEHLFNLKLNFTPDEFCILLNILKEKRKYDIEIKNSKITLFTKLVSENIDYLIEVVSNTKVVPKCLRESKTFRDECIKRNRIDLACKCVLPANITENDDLMNAYSKELNINPKDFYERCRWLLNYYRKNNNIFNTILATSLKNKIFNLKEEHFERFINDVEIQIDLTKLDDKQLDIFSYILEKYNYKNSDITLMIVNIIKNIHSYNELINSININKLTENEFKLLVSAFQLSNNPYKLNSVNDLNNYYKIKNNYFMKNFDSNNLNDNKDNLLKILFNIDLTEAMYINSKYCYDNKNNNILENLSNSELPKKIYNYLILINQIVECDDNSQLLILYNQLKDSLIYNNEIPLESYLRSKYTELYSKSLYRINERNQIYGPKDNSSLVVSYKGKNIHLCIPREKFNFFIHCVGSCSLATDVIDENYKVDWLDRPMIQDHFVACSYINEAGIHSIRSDKNIILGFDSLEGGSILGMGNMDIDSIGPSKSYNGSREIQLLNGDRAKFFVPSQMLKTINKYYNEIVIERRNTDKTKGNEFKRKPDYIIMMAEDLGKRNFILLDDLYHSQLPFISEEDKKEISKINNYNDLRTFLVKYQELISESVKTLGIATNNPVDFYANTIMKSKYYEDCLKASSEFDIPLVIVDKLYYFNKILFESSVYDDEAKEKISKFYIKSDDSKRRELFNTVAQCKDVSSIMNPNENRNISFIA